MVSTQGKAEEQPGGSRWKTAGQSRKLPAKSLHGKYFRLLQLHRLWCKCEGRQAHRAPSESNLMPLSATKLSSNINHHITPRGGLLHNTQASIANITWHGAALVRMQPVFGSSYDVSLAITLPQNESAAEDPTPRKGSGFLTDQTSSCR